LKHIAKKGKPIILSTGGCDMSDIRRAYDAIMPINQNMSILQCTSCYPSKFNELDLRVIQTLKELFPDIIIGFSGHDSGIAMAVAAYVLGAKIIEKHFTLNRANKGTDHAFSLEPIGLKKMCRDLKRCYEAMGDGTKKIYEDEIKPRMKMAKKIVAARNLTAGHIVAYEDLDFRSPGDGMPPYEYELIVGKTLNRDISFEEPFSLDFFK
jgi:N-acetylneuraminate synthase/sialic acid synthase